MKGMPTAAQCLLRIPGLTSHTGQEPFHICGVILDNAVHCTDPAPLSTLSSGGECGCILVQLETSRALERRAIAGPYRALRGRTDEK